MPTIGLLLLVAAGVASAQVARQPVDYMIVVTGGELLAGVYPDGHTHFLTRTLRPLGLHCVGSMCVDDKQADLTEAIRFATRRASLVIVTGGLGPTDNDITRQTLSEFTGIPLEENLEVLGRMTQRFRTPPDQLRANLRRQTRVPTRGTYLKNSNGTSVGLVFESADGVVAALPGPPSELQPMVREELVPYLSRRFGTRLPGCSLTLRFVGLGQSQIDQTLEEHVPLAPDITLSSQFDGSRVDFTFSLPDDTPEDRARLESLEREILKYLGDSVYADDETSLEEHVIGLLEGRGATLALVEVGSAGCLSAALSRADGTHRVLAGALVAPDEEGLQRLLRMPLDRWTAGTSSLQRTKLLAAAAADVTGSQWVVAVGQSQEDENGGRYVEVVFRLPDGHLESQQVRLRTGDSDYSRLTTQLLDQLRQRLQ